MNPNDVYAQPPTSVTADVWAEIGRVVYHIVATRCTETPTPRLLLVQIPTSGSYKALCLLLRIGLRLRPRLRLRR